MIKSFEEGCEIAGDILSRGKEKRKVKVGVLTCGYFEYWRMFPSMRGQVTDDLKTVTDILLSRYDNVVISGMVDTLDTADEAGQRFKRENVDAVILVYGTYTADFITLTALEYLKDLPLLIFSMQNDENIDRGSNYQQSLRNSGLIGIAQLTGTLRKIKRDFKIVVGCKEDERAYGKIDVFVKAVQAVNDLNEANIGIIGHVFRGMYDLELSKTFLKSTFGVNVILIQSSHLLEIWEEVKDEEVEAEKQKLLSRFQIKNTTENDIFNALKLAVAMFKIAKRFKLDAMCFLDQHFVQKQLLTSARMGASLLMERTDMSVNCEGDIGGLITMMLMKSVTGFSPLMAEWGEYDTETNSCLLMGHGIGTPDLAESEKEIFLARTPEEWGFDGKGLNYELILKPGKATVAHIMEAPEGYRMLLSCVESINFPRINYDELYAVVKTKLPVKEYLEKIMDFGVSHHCVVGMTDMTKTLELVAEMLKLHKFYIE